MKKIPLTQGLFAIVDDEDFEELMKHKWHVDKGNSTFYASRAVISGKQNVRMHRQIMKATSPKVDVDHKNGNGLDNRRCNLRLCSRTLNNANAKIPKDNKSGYKGVCWDRDRKKWAVKIAKIYIGRFNNLEDAVRAYNSKAREMYGDFARLKEF